MKLSVLQKNWKEKDSFTVLFSPLDLAEKKSVTKKSWFNPKKLFIFPYFGSRIKFGWRIFFSNLKSRGKKKFRKIDLLRGREENVCDMITWKYKNHPPSNIIVTLKIDFNSKYLQKYNSIFKLSDQHSIREMRNLNMIILEISVQQEVECTIVYLVLETTLQNVSQIGYIKVLYQTNFSWDF